MAACGARAWMSPTRSPFRRSIRCGGRAGRPPRLSPLITPHTAGGNHLADTERRIARIALDNLRRYLAGEALRNRVR